MVSEIPRSVDRNCAIAAAITAKMGTPHPNKEYGMKRISLETLNDPLTCFGVIFYDE
jgi:hypothetical protein